MTSRLCLLLAFVAMAAAVRAQTGTAAQKPPRFQLYGGYSFVSNSPNGTPGARQAMNGWNATFSPPGWHFVRFVLDVASYRGNNQGAKENWYSIMGGAQFTRRVGHERVFVEALGGDGGIGRYWGPNAAPGETATFASVVGGGFDTPFSRSLALRVSGGYQWSNFKLINNVTSIMPVRTPGIPNNFARISAGLVWSF
ncbi:MAG TPA: hypothetical protein VGG45_18860 [Terracidiphilus sp.]